MTANQATPSTTPTESTVVPTVENTGEKKPKNKAAKTSGPKPRSRYSDNTAKTTANVRYKDA